MKTPLRKRYSSDFKAQIIDLFNLGKTVPQLAEEFGVGTSILYRWVQPAICAGCAPRSPTCA